MAFALADCLDLIVSRYGRRTLFTSEVMDELGEGLVQGYTELRRVERLVQSCSLDAVERNRGGRVRRHSKAG